MSGQQEGIRRKPAPDGVWHILEVLGAEASECLYVGDSEVDIETGKNAGLKTISVSLGLPFRTGIKRSRSGAYDREAGRSSCICLKVYERKEEKSMYEYDEECLKTFLETSVTAF